MRIQHQQSWITIAYTYHTNRSQLIACIEKFFIWRDIFTKFTRVIVQSFF